MTATLLDANVLIALVVAEHEHHGVASRWAAAQEVLALCPLTEGALVRFLVRVGERATTAQEVVRALHGHPAVVRWPDDVSYADIDLDGVTGHRQVTDAYLAGLARHHDGALATFDAALVDAYPDVAVAVPAAG